MVYHLDFQTDGNLVLYRTSDSKPMWASGTYGNPGAILSTQPDGNIVIYIDKTKQSAVWSTSTNVQNATRTIIVPDVMVMSAFSDILIIIGFVYGIALLGMDTLI